MTPDQVRQYKEAGYTTVPGFFAPVEARALKREVDRWVDAGLPRNVSVPDGKRNLQLLPLWPHSRLFRAVPFHPKVVAAVSTLLGDPVVKILDQMFYKPAGDGMGTNWQHVHLTGADATGGEREYGEPVSFQAEMERLPG